MSVLGRFLTIALLLTSCMSAPHLEQSSDSHGDAAMQPGLPPTGGAEPSPTPSDDEAPPARVKATEAPGPDVPAVLEPAPRGAERSAEPETPEISQATERIQPQLRTLCGVPARMCLTDTPVGRPGRFHYAIAADLNSAEQIAVYDRPSGPRRTLVDRNEVDGIDLRYPLFPTTTFGGALVLRVVDRTQEPGDEEWLKVQVPVRPNMSTVWVRAADFDVKETSVWVQATVASGPGTEAGEIRVFDGYELVFSAPVASGRESRPTPMMTGWISEFIPGPPLSPAYGPWIIDLGGHSETLGTFGGGGQPRMVFHGTSQPDTIGHRVSSGALRLQNGQLDEFRSIPGLLGAPVIITPERFSSEEPSPEFRTTQPATTAPFTPNVAAVVPVPL